MSIVLVTGGSRGLGKAIALNLAAAGFEIIINYRGQTAAALEVAKQIESLGSKAYLEQFDISAKEQTEARITEIIKRYGTPYALINNAGITKDNLFPMMSKDAWSEVLTTNLESFYFVTRPIIRHMLRASAGRIINITSVCGEAGNAGQVNYSASKAGLIGATKALALELAPRNITVNAVAPGFIETDMTKELPQDKIIGRIPLGRIGKPEEVAALVTFLCSKDAAYITGQVLRVNGGLYM